jgi:hypothetical protein
MRDGDANLFCDVINADRFRARDARWGSKRYNSSASYRKVIAITNSINRFFLLRKSLDNINNVGIRRAELQIVATAP